MIINILSPVLAPPPDPSCPPAARPDQVAGDVDGPWGRGRKPWDEATGDPGRHRDTPGGGLGHSGGQAAPETKN